MSNLPDAIAEAFTWIETRNMRVGRIWLNPEQGRELRSYEGFDVAASSKVIEHLRELTGATLIGFLWGVQVFESDVVVSDHIAITPDGMDVRLIDSSACMPLIYPEST